MVNKWNDAYKLGFKMYLQKPSVVVKESLDRIPENSLVLDLGCGNGRNSIYSVSQSHHVHAVDLVDYGFIHALPERIKSRIKFYNESVFDFDMGQDKYDAVIMTRLIMYLNQKDVILLIGRVFKCLKNPGVFIMNFSVSGGVFDSDDFTINVFAHNIENIVRLLESSGFKKIQVKTCIQKSNGFTATNNCKSYEIISRKIK